MYLPGQFVFPGIIVCSVLFCVCFLQNSVSRYQIFGFFRIYNKCIMIVEFSFYTCLCSIPCFIRIIMPLRSCCFLFFICDLCLLLFVSARITAYGAAGGRSVLAMSRSHGVYITGDFLLRRGELLYILVGQQGEDACPNVSVFYSLFFNCHAVNRCSAANDNL